ncbi:type 2 lantipeptide synthetase LanM [Brevundimonas sp. BAL450]|uniref:type 2 lanthipeptide synthetase LanM n=1 Tax=Brevundimonas sp. BAL450 TaxID=1708162 RepID=UPI0018CB5FD1|nr:type 2 lanthipeptide synthetase LanM [Brevundimonas sp. BAL450]MBG7613756.1 type 2 lantipeptide synthetase LanM [Brevundimonas sp. BAL450]
MISTRTLSPKERVDLFNSGPGKRSAAGALERWSWWQRAYFERHETAWLHWLETWTGGGDGLSVVEIDTGFSPTGPSREGWFDHLDGVRQRADVAPPHETDDEDAPLSAIAAVIHPFLDHADAQLQSGLAACGFTNREEGHFRSGALTWLTSRLRAIAAPSTSVAVNIHRLVDHASESDPAERACRFEKLVRSWPSRQALLEATPVLDRLLAQVCMDSIAACLECARRYAEDKYVLEAEFGIRPTGLEGVVFGLGDPHRHGRTVARFRYEENDDLVYKPRSMGADLAFNGLVTWLSDHLADAPEPVPTLGRGDYGWARFVKAHECADEAEIARAYRRTGILLAAFDLCAGSDLHFENIIYEGVNPVIVDLETLLCPTVIQSEEYATLCYQARTRSILRTGYLPGGAVVGGFRRDFSASALHTTLETPYQEQVFLDGDGDTLAVRLKPFLMQPRENCARMGARRIPVAAHLEALAEGIEAACRVFAERAGDLLHAGGPLAAFRDIEIRWVPRGTTAYGQALRSSLHPAHMRDGMDHELAWAELAIWSSGGRSRKDILQAEISDLWRCDIPLFTTTATSTHAWSSDGLELADVFSESGWESLCRRVRALGRTATDQSARAASCAFESIEAKARPHPFLPAEPVENLSPDILLEEAARIGHRLLDDSFDVEGHLFWVTPASMGKFEYSASVTEFDLYQGGTGIGLFLHELGLATGCDRFTVAAEACRTSVEFCGEAARPRAGAFNGLSGIVYAGMRLAGGPLNIDVEWTRAVLARLAKALEDDQTFDVIGGSSGAILVLRHLVTHPKLGDEAGALIQQCAAHLQAASRDDADGVFWPSAGLDTPSGGFAHGAAGHAAALAVAGACLGSRQWDDLVLRALTYSARSVGGGSWCHGDVGRLTAIDLIREHCPHLAEWPHSHAAAWRLTRENSLEGGNDSLCHGVLGNLDGLVDGDEKDRALALRAASGALRRSRNTGWLPSVANLNPGLMLGHAGIGYQLLRVRAPSIGSILSLGITK